MSSSLTTFSFEMWLKQNELLDYKDLFIHYGLNTIDSINTSSSNYHKLLSDAKIVSNPLLISKIALTVNNLQTMYQSLKHTLISKMESKLEELKAYEQENGDDMNGFTPSLLFNHRLYEIEKNKDEKQLNDIRIQIQDLFLSIFKVLKKKEQLILKKFKTIQHEILNKYNKIIEKMKQNDDEIAIQKDYLRHHINYHKHGIKDHMTNGYDSIFEMKQVLHKIGKIIRKNDSKTRKLVNEKQTILDDVYFDINDEIRDYIMDNIDELISFERKRKQRRKASSLRSIKSKSYNPNGTSPSPTVNTQSTGNQRHTKHRRTALRRNSSNIELNKRSMTSNNLDLINMTPNRIKRLKYIKQDEDYKYNMIDIELMPSSMDGDIKPSNIGIMYLYHCNEEDEKEKLVVNGTAASENDGENDGAPNTPFYTNDEMTFTKLKNKLSEWKKCKNISIKGANHIIIKIGIPLNQNNADCVWIKLIEHSIGIQTTSFPITPVTKLMVESGQTVKLQSSVEYNFDEIVIQKNGILTVNCSSKGYLLLKIRDKLEIHSHGKLNVTGLGHKGGKRYTAGEGKGGGGGCAKGGALYPCGGGGGYGTFGANGNGWNDNIHRENVDGIGGNVYGDSSLTTIHFGSGGGGGYGSRGGNGGGIICISCKNKIILHENSGIYANGEKGKYYYDGCGSGGSIFIKCKYLYNINNSLCFIQAIGGKHSIEADETGHGGNGGFGRIRVYSQNIKNIQQLKEQAFVVQPLPYIG